MTCWALRYWALVLRRLLLGFSVSNLRPTSHQLWLSSKGMLDLPLSLSLSACSDCLHTDLNQPKHNLQTASTFWHSPPLDQYFYDFYALLVDGRCQPAASSARSHGLCTWKTTEKPLFFPQPARHGYSEHFGSVLAMCPKIEADTPFFHVCRFQGMPKSQTHNAHSYVPRRYMLQRHSKEETTLQITVPSSSSKRFCW